MTNPTQIPNPPKRIRITKQVRSSKLAEAENIEHRKAEQDRIYGPEYETFTK